MRLDLVFLGTAALVWIVTSVAGGFKITQAEGQSVSLSFYTLLAPLLAWLGLTLLAVRLLLGGFGRLKPGAANRLGRLTTGTILRSTSRRSLALGSGIVAAALAVAFGSSVALFIATYDAEKQADARFVIGSDIRVTPSLLSQQSIEFASKLRVPGVTAVTPIAQTASAVVGTDKRALVAVEANSFPVTAPLSDAFFQDLSASAAMAALRADPSAVLVSVEMTKTFNIQVGDMVNMQLVDRAGNLQRISWIPSRNRPRHKYLLLSDGHRHISDLNVLHSHCRPLSGVGGSGGRLVANRSGAILTCSRRDDADRHQP
jgi:putative ABC transport system permease protein